MACCQQRAGVGGVSPTRAQPRSSRRAGGGGRMMMMTIGGQSPGSPSKRHGAGRARPTPSSPLPGDRDRRERRSAGMQSAGRGPEEMAIFVRGRGAWGGAQGFRKVRGPLREAGHEVFTPSLTGIGERVHLTSPLVCLKTHITDLTNNVLYEDRP